MSALYRGVPTDGNYDPTVFQDEAYKEFEKKYQQQIFCVGGDPAQRDELLKNPNDFNQLTKWRKSSGPPEAYAIHSTGIWEVMREMSDGECRNRAGEFQDAFTLMLRNVEVVESH